MFARKSRGVARALTLVISGVGIVGVATTLAQANTPIDTNQPYYLESQVGVTVNPDFQGGTLRIDNNNTIDSYAYNVENFSTNTIDAFGNDATFTGNFTGAGPLTFTDSVGGGIISYIGVGSYSGATTVDSGATLSLGDGSGTAGLLAGAITDNGSLLFNEGSGVLLDLLTGITGSGSTEIVSGEVELTGINSYSGTTTIDSGATLSLGDGSGTVGLLAGAITDNGSLLFNEGSGVLLDLFTGVAGSGSAEIVSGKVELAGTNTYTGTTTIDSGATLSLGDGSGTGGTVAGDIVDNGLLQFDYAGSQTAANTISGSGSAEAVGGTMIVTGISTLGGTVTIDSGATMQWGNGAPAFLVGGGNAVTDNGSLVIDFGGGGVGGSIPISGTGSVTLQSGALNDGGVSTYSGATTIDSGAILLLSGSGSISNSSGVTDNGTFDISGETAGTSITSLSGSGGVSLGGKTLTLSNASGTFSGVLADGGFSGGTAGSLTIAGGSETLTGTNTYTGTTTIDSGATLVVGDAANPGAVLDSTVGGVHVNSGGTLKGHGTINGAVTNNGTVVAGGSIGTLTVGSFSQGPGGTLSIEVAPTEASQLKSLGAAKLDGTLALTFDPGAYGAAIDQIVTGAPVTGMFANITTSGTPGIVFGITYTPTSVDLVTEATAYAQAYGGISAATFDQARSLARTVEGRLNDCSDADVDGSHSTCQDFGVWAKGFASGDQFDSHGGYLGFHNAAQGVIGGIDKNWADASSLGVAVSYGYDTLHMAAASSKASGASYFAALYGRLVDGATWFDGQAFYMHNDWSVRRSIPGFGTATSSPGGDTEGVLLEASTAIDTPDLRPYLQGAYARIHRQSATETGVGPLGYAVSSDSSNLGYVEAGIRFAHSYALENSDVIRPALQFGVQENFGDLKQNVTASLSGLSGTGFEVAAAQMDGIAAVADASVDVTLSPSFDLTADLQGHVGNGHAEGMALLGGAFKF